MCLALSSLRDRHMNPVLRDSFPSTYTNTTITPKSLFPNVMLLRLPFFKNHYSYGVMSPRLPAIPKHRHTSSCVSLSSAFAAAIYKPRRGTSSCTLQHTPKLRCTKLEDTTLHVAAPSFCPEKSATRRLCVLLPSLCRSRRRV
jgi:hypothetical protein